MISFSKKETDPCQSCIRNNIKCSDKTATKNGRQGLRIRKVVRMLSDSVYRKLLGKFLLRPILLIELYKESIQTFHIIQ